MNHLPTNRYKYIKLSRYGTTVISVKIADRDVFFGINTEKIMFMDGKTKVYLFVFFILPLLLFRFVLFSHLIIYLLFFLFIESQ